MSDLPPCREWAIWVGKEVEGTTNVGVTTLFIRSLEGFHIDPETSDLSFFRKKTGASRVWFCREFVDWKLLKRIAKEFDEVCIEVEPKCFENIPLALRDKAIIYLKVDTPLKPGDFVCVGPAFHDESFKIGSGSKVKPQDYLQDKRIL